MSETTLPVLDAAEAPQTLGRRTVAGVLWLLAQTLGSKGATLVGQYLLAWLLNKEEFGLIALALTVSSFAGVTQQLGVRQVLIQRGARLAGWANAGFWMSLAAGALAALTIAASAPLAAALYHDRRLIGPLLVLALAAPCESLWTVPSALLSSRLRFGVLAGCGLFNTVATTLLTLFLAWSGMGIYSIVLPRPLVALAQAAILWRRAPLRLRWSPQLGRWRFLLPDAATLMAVGLLTAFLLQGDYLLLGLTAPAAVVGVYYFAYSLSSQSLQLISASLGSALFPALSTLQGEPSRQMRSCLNACRLLALVGVPACFIQAALGGPLIRLMFAERWLQAIPVFQCLSVGMAMIIAGTPATSLMQAQGRFRRYFFWTAFCAAGFLLHVGVGVLWGGALSVGRAVTLFYFLFGPLGLYTAVQPAGGGWRDVARVFALPLALGGLATSAAVGAVRLTGLEARGELWHALAVLLLASSLYLAGALRFAGADVRLLCGHLRPLARRALGKEF